MPAEEIKSHGALDGSGMHYLKDVGWGGTVIVKAVPPGRYMITKIDIRQDSGGAAVSGVAFTLGYRADEDLSIPVSVSSNRATYLGEFRTLYLAKKNFIGMEGWYGFRCVVSDQNSRDLPIARIKMPELGPVDVAVPAVDALHEAWIGSEP